MQLKMIELKTKTETVILLNCTFKNNFQHKL